MDKNKKKLSWAMLFMLLFGIVSLFSDMTHEGASSGVRCGAWAWAHRNPY